MPGELMVTRPLAFLMRCALPLTLLAAIGLALGRATWYVSGNPWAVDSFLIVHGLARRPWVFRVLSALLVQLLAYLTGLPWYAVIPPMQAGAYVVWLWAFYALACACFSSGRALLATVAAPIFLLPFIDGGLHVYDIPSLALFTIGLALIAHARWAVYLAFFPLAMFARETAAALAVVYALQAARHLPRRVVLRGLLYQTAAALAVKVFLAWRFAANDGALFEMHWHDHLAYFGLLPPPVYDSQIRAIPGLLLLALGCVVLLWRWRSLPAILQSGLALVPVYVVFYFAFVWPGELRAVIEIFPVLYLLVTAFFLAPRRRELRYVDPQTQTAAAVPG